MTMFREGEDKATEEVYKWIGEMGVKIEEQKSVYKWFGKKVE